jgi:hypothetical protein
MEKHLAACDAEEDLGHGRLWRRLAGYMSSLVSLPVQTVGSGALLFFTPDGKYRMQVFTLEDRRDGFILIYIRDILQEAIDAGLIGKSGELYTVKGGARGTISLSAIDASNSPDAASHIKHLIGWNRKALRITLTASMYDAPQVDAAEALCALAAKAWQAA